MLRKIISGGQTGADRAALDFAIKNKIRHGGWCPKGRLAEDGRLPAKYKLWQMPTDSYQKRTEQNAIDSDGTIIFSHGRLIGGSAYTRTMARRHNKPYLHIDLNDTDIFIASLMMLEWIDEKEIKILNVAGPRASKDPKIYKDVTAVLSSCLFIQEKRQGLNGSPRLKKTPTAKSFKRPTTVEEAVELLMQEINLKGLTNLAKIQEDDLIYLHFTLGMWIRNNFVNPRNEELLQSCRQITNDQYLHWIQVPMVVVRSLWKKLQETHKLKVVR